MKHFYRALLFWFMSVPLAALPVGNPADASMLKEGVVWSNQCYDPCIALCEAWTLRIGFYGDYVVNRHLKTNDIMRRRGVEETRIVTNAAYLALNFYDRADFFTTLGATDFHIYSNRNTFSLGFLFIPARFTLNSTTNFSWSVGGRVSIWEWGCTTFGGEVQYFCAKLNVRNIVDFNSIDTFPVNVKNNYREWQLGLGLSHRIQMIVPYIAVKWSGARVNFGRSLVMQSTGGADILFNLENDRSTGFALGVSFIGCERVSFTVEGRFADERAVHVNGQIRF